MKENFQYICALDDGSIIMDTGISGSDFGNDGYGTDVLKKCREYGTSLMNKHIKYNDKDYSVVEYDVMLGYLGNYGSICIRLEKV